MLTAGAGAAGPACPRAKRTSTTRQTRAIGEVTWIRMVITLANARIRHIGTTPSDGVRRPLRFFGTPVRFRRSGTPRKLGTMTGRAQETAVVLALAENAASGRAGTLLVSGEAGVGKTSLVRDACATIPARVLWAPCLPLTSLAAPLLPLHTALRDAADPPPLHTANAVLEFDAWLDRQAR